MTVLRSLMDERPSTPMHGGIMPGKAKSFFASWTLPLAGVALCVLLTGCLDSATSLLGGSKSSGKATTAAVAHEGASGDEAAALTQSAQAQADVLAQAIAARKARGEGASDDASAIQWLDTPGASTAKPILATTGHSDSQASTVRVIDGSNPATPGDQTDSATIIKVGIGPIQSDGVKEPKEVRQPDTGPQPLKISTVQLCRRVKGFGVYDTFDHGSRFMAGRNQRMIVYLELENFHSAKTADAQGDLYRVQLEQEVRLYSEADGFEVWRQDPVKIVDESRNVRRDFFVVQMIELPGRLGVGRFRLKVRVTDSQGKSIDEVSIPIEIVADQTLVQGK